MDAADKYDVVVLGSGTGGKWMATTMAQEGMRTAVVERRYIGASCVNIACLPSKNVIHAAKVASLFRRAIMAIDTVRNPVATKLSCHG